MRPMDILSIPDGIVHGFGTCVLGAIAQAWRQIQYCHQEPTPIDFCSEQTGDIISFHSARIFRDAERIWTKSGSFEIKISLSHSDIMAIAVALVIRNSG